MYYIPFVFGIGSCWFFTQRLAWLPVVLMLLAGLSCLFVAYKQQRKTLRHGCLIFLCFLLGVSWVNFAIQRIQSNALPTRYLNHQTLVRGTITSLIITDPLKSSFTFTLGNIKPGTKINVSWYGKTPTLHVGDTWQLLLKIKANHGFANPGSFDLERWLFIKHIMAHAYVKKSVNNIKLGHDFSFNVLVTHWRAQIRQKLLSLLSDNPMLGLLLALLIGDRSLIKLDMWQVFKNTGTSHLMAISGLHVGLVAGLAFILSRKVWTLLGQMSLLIPANKMAAVFAVLAAVMYSLLSGLAIPSQRALIMLLVLMLSVFYKRYLPSRLTLKLAFILVLLYDPLAVLSASFWLSFTAVAMMFYGLQGHLFPPKYWQQWGRAQWVVWLGLLPMSLLFFSQFSLSAPLANLIAIPFVSLIIVPLALCGLLLLFIFPTMAYYIFLLCTTLLTWAWPWVSRLANIKYLQYHTSLNSIWVFMLLLLFSLIILLPKKLPSKYLSIIFLLPLIFPRQHTLAGRQVQLNLLDVGQGLSTVIRTAHHVLIYDTGARLSERFDLGKMVVLPFLASQHIQHINRMIISHGDNDHSGGAKAILQQLPVDLILTSIPSLFKTYHVQACHRGQHWHWDGVNFKILYPLKQQDYQDNNSSCVLAIKTGGQQILLTGDIEAVAEHQLLQYSHRQLKSTVLVAPHHGSKTSSSWPFINAVEPRLVLIPAGYHNRFHLPNRQVIKRYQHQGSAIMSTAKSGMIRVLVTPQGIHYQRGYRLQARHFWQQQLAS